MNFYGFNNDIYNALEINEIRYNIPKYKTYLNAFYYPPDTSDKLGCFYDESGNLIVMSCRLRGIDKINLSQAPLSISPIKKLKYMKGQYIFLGPIESTHYGHFLTEGLARLWFYFIHQRIIEKYNFLYTDTYFKKFNYTIKLFLGAKQRRKFYTIAKYIDFDIKKLIFFNEPVVIEKVIIPEPSFSLRAEVFDSHKLVFEKVSDSITEKQNLEPTNTPLYISRRKLYKPLRKIYNEEKIEQYLRLIGCKIIYPEKLSLERQIILFNTHKIIIGCRGSAFHTLLFTKLSGLKTICFAPPNLGPYSNSITIDKLKGIDSHYINCLDRINPYKREFIIDYNKAIYYLKQIL